MTGRKAAERALGEARRWIGTPYRHQGAARGIGCDCLGLLRGVWRTLYGCEPERAGPYSADWAEFSPNDPLLDAARRHCLEKALSAAEPGDILLFRWRAGAAAKHLGILSEHGRFIHAYSGSAVVESALVPQWRRRIVGVFAFPEIQD